jgi:hypothetical protein
VGYEDPQETSSATLPSSLDIIFNQFEVAEAVQQIPKYEFMWNTQVEEGREKKMLARPFTTSTMESLPSPETSPNDIAIAEAALKVGRCAEICGSMLTVGRSFWGHRVSDMIQKLPQKFFILSVTISLGPLQEICFYAEYSPRS